MGICPLCNALESQTYSCQNCQSILQDYGKAVDYIDDYSAYMIRIIECSRWINT